MTVTAKLVNTGNCKGDTIVVEELTEKGNWRVVETLPQPTEVFDLWEVIGKVIRIREIHGNGGFIGETKVQATTVGEET